MAELDTKEVCKTDTTVAEALPSPTHSNFQPTYQPGSADEKALLRKNDLRILVRLRLTKLISALRMDTVCRGRAGDDQRPVQQGEHLRGVALAGHMGTEVRPGLRVHHGLDVCRRGAGAGHGVAV